MFRFALIIVTVLLVSACSKTEWAVKWADTYISWKLIDQFEFAGPAKKMVREQARQIVDTIRREKFHEVSAFLESAALDVGTIDLDQPVRLQKRIEERLLSMEQFFYSLIALVGPQAEKVAQLVENKNWQSFKRNFEKENTKILKAKPECVDKFHDQLEKWMGAVAPKQRLEIQNYCRQRVEALRVRIENRRQLLKILDNWALTVDADFSQQGFVTAVGRWMKNYKALQSPEALSRWREGQAALALSMTRILQMSSSAQRRTLAANLHKQAHVFRRMAL